MARPVGLGHRGARIAGRVLGVPGVTIAGVASILAGTFVRWLYQHYPQFGGSNKANMFEWVFGVVAAALIFYHLVRWILRARRGVKLELVYAEIPPE